MHAYSTWTRRLFFFADRGTLMNISTSSMYILTAFGRQFSPKWFTTVHSLLHFISIVYTLGIDSKTLQLQVSCSTSWATGPCMKLLKVALVFKINMKQIATHCTSCKIILKVDQENCLDPSVSEFFSNMWRSLYWESKLIHFGFMLTYRSEGPVVSESFSMAAGLPCCTQRVDARWIMGKGRRTKQSRKTQERGCPLEGNA